MSESILEVLKSQLKERIQTLEALAERYSASGAAGAATNLYIEAQGVEYGLMLIEDWEDSIYLEHKQRNEDRYLYNLSPEEAERMLTTWTPTMDRAVRVVTILTQRAERPIPFDEEKG